MDSEINNFSFDINNIKSISDYVLNIINESKKCYNKLLEINNSGQILQLLNNDINYVSVTHNILNLLLNLSNLNIKNEILVLINKINNFDNLLYKNVKIYNKIKSIKLDNNTNNKLFIEKIIKCYEKNGINLSKDKYNLLLETKNKINTLEKKLKDKIKKEENKTIGIKLKNINTLPKNIIDTFPIVSNNPIRYGVNLNYENYKLLITNISDESIRKKLYNIYNNKCTSNLDLLSNLIFERNNLSEILNHDNFFKMNVSNQSIQNDQVVKELIFEVISNTNDKLDKEYKMLSKIKNKYENNSIVHKWDLEFYVEKWKKNYSNKNTNFNEYFQFDNTINEILRLISDIFDIRFKKKKIDNLWHSDVEYYQIYDMDKNLIGSFFLDLFERKNKENQIKFFQIQSGCQINENKKQLPVSCLSMFIKKNDNNLINFSTVITLFSEFGHIIQNLYSYNDFSLLSGLSTKPDINKVIPLIFENICWEKEIIKRLSKHYITQKSLSENDIKKIINLKNMNNGIYYKLNSLFSIFDLLLYSSKNFSNHIKETMSKNKNVKKELKDIYKNTYNKLVQNFFPNDKLYLQKLIINDNFPPLWNHLISGNSKFLYTSIINEIIATEVYDKVFKNKLNNKKIINNFKKYFLGYYNTINPYKLIFNLLEKNIDTSSFLSLKGLKNKTVNESIFFTPKTNTSIRKNRYLKYADQKKCITISSIENSTDSEEYLLTSNNGHKINRFSEINEYSIETSQNNNNNLNDSINNTYMSENSDTLKRYTNIFVKN